MIEQNKYILITGGTRGLGLSIAKNCLSEGYRVVVIGRKNNADYEYLQNKYQEKISIEKYDFSDLSGIHNFACNINEKYGCPWGLINNAAIGKEGILATMHENDILETIRVNVEAPILFTKYMIRPMLIKQQGRIINISSIIANTGFSGLSVYAATKAAIYGFTKSLAREVGRLNITVNSVSPGYMYTDMVKTINLNKIDIIKRRSPMKKLIDVNDAANAVIFLLGENAASITGTNITVDAGSTA